MHNQSAEGIAHVGGWYKSGVITPAYIQAALAFADTVLHCGAAAAALAEAARCVAGARVAAAAAAGAGVQAAAVAAGAAAGQGAESRGPGPAWRFPADDAASHLHLAGAGLLLVSLTIVPRLHALADPWTMSASTTPPCLACICAQTHMVVTDQASCGAQGSQCSDELVAAAEEAARAIQQYEGAAAPTEGSVHMQQGAEPPEFASLLQLPQAFQPQPCSAYDADFEVLQEVALWCIAVHFNKVILACTSDANAAGGRMLMLDRNMVQVADC